MSQVLSVLSNGITLFNDDFFRGIACMTGAVQCHELPDVKTDNNALMTSVERAGGFGFAVTRSVKPGLFSYQRGIDGVTRSCWGHTVVGIGEEVGYLARKSKPGLLIKKPSPRWNNSPTHPSNIGRGMKITDTTDGNPVPWVEGIKPEVKRLEIVESKIYVEVNSLSDKIEKGEQVIFFTNPNWTMDQKVAIACEAYSWVGEPYDIFEIANWVMPLVPNPAKLKACSTLALQCINAGDNSIKDWCKYHGLDPERVAPRDLFAWGADKNLPNFSFRCQYADALKV
jgi:hypothetical protein